MDAATYLAGSLLWASALSVVFYAACIIAIGFLAKKSAQLKRIGSSLKIIALFFALQLFLHFGASRSLPRISRQLDFLSWLVFTFAALRLGLYVYGDLFVVRWKRGSFPAAFKNIITAVVLVIVALVLLKEVLDINVTSFIATTTVLTATIGLAFQSTLANMLAGLTIHLEKPLKQGDWIALGEHEGRVMDISLRSTRIMTIARNEVFIPNSKVLSEAVVNFSLPNTVQIRKLSVGASYAVAPNRVKNAVLEALAAVPRVLKAPAPLVRVTNYGEFAVYYEIRYSINNFSASIEIEAEIMSLIWYAFKRSGIEIPYPVRSLQVRQITQETRREEQERRAQDILGLMEKVEILSPLSPVEREKLVDRLSVKVYAAGEVPVKQGDPGDSFYIIKTGKVEVVVQKTSGESSVVAALGAGEFFGEMSLLTGAARTASIRVKEDAEFIVIDKESFASTLANNPSIIDSLSHILSERQAGLDAERERLDAASLERRRKDESHRMITKIKDFFGLLNE
jgi:small-conductance mechanosensitive channel/CRP-like cAMP-binding protein